MAYLQFLPSFLFGTVSAAFQIEGSPVADCKGKSIWGVFTHTPRKIRTGEYSGIAYDFDRDPERDLAMMTELGFNGCNHNR